MTTVLGSGLGAQAVAKAQSSFGGTFMSTGQRTLIFKSVDLEIDPGIVQGGPYLAADQLGDLLSARVLTLQLPKFTIKGDMQSTAAALLLVSALGTSSGLSQLGTTPAYGLGGASGAAVSAPDLNNTWFDFQLSLPDTSGTPNPLSFHSCWITKAEWVFDRVGITTFSYDCEAQYAENSTLLLSATEPTSQVPFSMSTSSGTAGSAIPAGSSGFAIGTYGSEVIQAGIKKMTVTMTRKMAMGKDRAYGGIQYQESPVTNGYIEVAVSMETDFTPAVYSDLVQNLLSGDATSVIAQSVGSLIGGTYYNTFALNVPAFVVDDPKAYPSLSGADVLKPTISGTGKIDTSGHPLLNGTLITADTTL